MSEDKNNKLRKEIKEVIDTFSIKVENEDEFINDIKTISEQCPNVSVKKMIDTFMSYEYDIVNTILALDFN